MLLSEPIHSRASLTPLRLSAMSSLGFVKSQRVPTQISGEDELFQKELSAIKLKLQAAPGRAARKSTAREREKRRRAVIHSENEPTLTLVSVFAA